MEDAAEGSIPDIHGARRFAMITGSILFIYSLAGGHLTGKVQSSLIDLGSFDRPWILLAALALVSAYAGIRYWYFAIVLPLTRTKIRKYLRTPESILAFVGKKHDYRASVETGSHADYLALHSFLTSKSPPGLDPFDLVVGAGQSTSSINEIAWDQVRAMVARQYDPYFPGIKFEQISLWQKDMKLGTAWASVGNVKISTSWYTFLEDADLYLPLWLNGIAIVIFGVSLLVQ